MAVRDLPDYTREMIIKYTGGFIGLEELAVRLRSIVSWDLQGNVVLLEDFEGELTEWNTATFGTGASVSRSGLKKYSGDWSGRLVTGSTAGAYATLQRDLPMAGATKLAVFCRLGLNDNEQQIDIDYTADQSPNGYTARISIRPLSEELYYIDEDYNYQLLDDNLYLGSSLVLWYPVLLVADFTTGYYVKVVINNHVYDLSDKKMYSYPQSNPIYDGFLIEANRLFSSGTSFYIDDIIVAKNVP